MVQRTERIEWLDVLKGIGVILVILGHALGDCYIKTWVYAFHLGIFYYAAGYTFSPDKYTNIWQFAKKKIKTIIIPYLFYSLLCIVFVAFWNLAKGQQSLTEVLESGLNSCIGTVIMLRGSCYEGYCWFLPLICFINILYFAIYAITKKNRWVCHFVVILLYLLGIVYQKYIGVSLPLYIDAIPVAMLLFHLGCVTKNTLFTKQTYVGFGISVILTFVIAFLQYRVHFRSDLYEHTVGFPISFFVSNTIGIYMALQLSLIIKRQKVIAHLGRNSLRFYALHRPIVFYPLKLVLSWGLAKIIISTEIRMYTQGFLLTIVSIAIIILILPFVTKVEKWFIRIFDRNECKKC